MKEIHIAMDKTWMIDEMLHACIGYFDGIHQGHQKLIKTVVELANTQGGLPALITFDPDPWVIIKNMQNIPHLMSMEERKKAAAELGIRAWIVLDFTKEMSVLSIAQFHERILFPLPLKTLVCGYDFHYAHLGKGNIQTLRSQDRFALTVIEEVSSDFTKISSTRIEALIKDGQMEKAEALLTRAYQMSGIVVDGLKNGRKMGFPTANLQCDTLYVCPKEGVYAGYVTIEGIAHPAMINVGKNPTVANLRENRIEAHLFDFDEDIYGKQVTFSFLHYLREDRKFSGLAALKQQLETDRRQSLAYFERREQHASSSI